MTKKETLSKQIVHPQGKVDWIIDGKDYLDVFDVMDFIKNIKEPIELELKVAKEHKTQTSTIVQLLLNQILKNINNLAGKKLIQDDRT